MSTRTTVLDERDKRIAAARGPFERVRDFLPYGWWGDRAPKAMRRVLAATRAVVEWRRANNQSLQGDELEALAVRVAADQFAEDIAAAAPGAGQDPATIAWVLAGLRCPARPFCAGCAACFTITSPLRPHEREKP